MILDEIVTEISQWLDMERKLGAADPACVVLSTVDAGGIPHSRIVAVREISSKGVLFFTHQKSRKVQEMEKNPNVSMTFWFALQQKEIVLEGQVVALAHHENQRYWNSIPRERQLKLSAFYPTSGETIQSNEVLDKQLEIISNNYDGMNIPMQENYCGFICQPSMVYFYTLGEGKQFSNVTRYIKLKEDWQKELISP